MNEPNELMHYGVLGMKWGQHRARKNYEKAKTHRAYADDLNPKNYTVNLSSKQRSKLKKQSSSQLAKAKKYEAKAKAIENKLERKNAINNTYKSINKNASFGEKLTYNNATRKKAAKYVVDNNMSISEANKKAKSDAWRNSAALIAAYGAVAIGSYAINKKLG